MRCQSNCPEGMLEDLFERRFILQDEQLDNIWHKLNLRESFVRGQVFPYRVEFETIQQEGPFESGELNVHHGPMLSVHGAIGEITENYRGLDYFYGSYVLSFRWIRPVQLEFLREDGALVLRLHSYVKPWMRPFWRAGNAVFWKFFGATFLR